MFRSYTRMLRAARRPEFWRMYVRLPLVVTPGFRAAYAYTTGIAHFPSDWKVRTPLGNILLTADTVDDLLTIGECFGKLDYPVDPEARLIVDAGANAGYSAMYFLTHAPKSHVICIEPDQRNVTRLKRVVDRHGFSHRITLLDCAVGPKTDLVSFKTEPTGRYGQVELDIGTGGSTSTLVEMRSINQILEMALERTDRIDVLKLDIEGLESAVLQSANPELLAKVSTVFAETPDPAPVIPDTIRSRQGGVVQWRRLQGAKDSKV